MFQHSHPAVKEDPSTKKPEKEDEEPPTKKRNHGALDDLLGEVFVTHDEPEKSTLNRVEDEVGRYKRQPSIPLSACLFTWWKERETEFPLLSKAAKIYLCIPATSVPSERVFSTAGDIVTAQRATLSADNVDKLIFLKKNHIVTCT